MVRVAINGFGRIGRMVFKLGINEPGIEFVEKEKVNYQTRNRSKIRGHVRGAHRGQTA